MVLYFQVLLLHHQLKSRHLRYQEVQKMRRMPSWYVNSTTDCDDEESKTLFLSQLSNAMFLSRTFSLPQMMSKLHLSALEKKKDSFMQF